jgi:two-component system LytT family sensor kinase
MVQSTLTGNEEPQSGSIFQPWVGPPLLADQPTDHEFNFAGWCPKNPHRRRFPFFSHKEFAMMNKSATPLDPCLNGISKEVQMKTSCWRDLWDRWIVVFGLSQILAVILTLQRYSYWEPNNELGSRGDYLYGLAIDHLINGFVWGILTLLILCLTRKFRLDSPHRWRNLLIMLGMGLVISVLHLVIYIHLYAAVTPLLFPNEPHYTFKKIISLIFKLNPYWRLIHFLPLVFLSYAYDYYQLSLQGARKAAELEAKLAKAHLQALQMQLHPHFLFNTLNAIYVLVREDAEAACRMLETLSSLLRITLKKSNQTLVPLGEELEFLKLYMSIEQTRFNDRLKIEFEIAPLIQGALVPNFILQPLVENAILHGVTQTPGEGQLKVSAHRQNRQLILQVQDNGPGLRPPAEFNNGCGIGLANTRERLRQLFGQEQKLELTNLPQGGLCATVSFPFQETPTHPEIADE